MKRRHLITSFIVLIFPVIVISALTNYGFDKPVLENEKTEQVEPKSEFSCHKKSSQKQVATPGSS
ncbi:hypothetical protein [Poritiphilus flavus]|uniref:Uncharacterized protein n=1 Tax=Poritiphilus flavus TaxID=2697053 RepID=A0A6L9E902_9FLAO|nr:hypothetical protein [Poritiphilus flavus]NAS11071.1 hypothetical protein [Poritiphilus flavus]